MDTVTESLNRELIDFIEKSPTCFQAVNEIEKYLAADGFSELSEERPFTVRPGGKYYITRNGSSVLAFKIPESISTSHTAGFQIVASHCDSPCFKIKEHPEMPVEGHYMCLNVERYGGMIMAPWLDRPLSVAGRLLVDEDGVLRTRLFKADRDMLVIPSLAIHMNREVNEGYKYNPQKDMIPLYAGNVSAGQFLEELASLSGVRRESIAGMDLFVCNRQKGTIWGPEGEFVSSPRLDDMQCVFSSLKGFLEAAPSDRIAVLAVFDNEEVGSQTRQGAGSAFFRDSLRRIAGRLGFSEEDFLAMLAHSFMLSADNAHGVHPNHTDKADPTNRPLLGKGIVLKHNAAQKYTTDGISTAFFRKLCREKSIPVQEYANRSDIPGGSTLGNIAAARVPVNSADIGLPQLAMHSPYETAGSADTVSLYRACRAFYESSLSYIGQGSYRMTIR